MMNFHVALRTVAAVLLAVVLATAGRSGAALIPYMATLTGPAESPPDVSPGIGFAEVDFDSTANTLHVQLSFTGLLGQTTAAHIHAGTAVPGAGTAGVATQTPSFSGFPLGVTSGTYDQTFDLTSASSYSPAFITANGGTPASAEAALAASMAAGTSYINLHTTIFPNGEIRGFLLPVPEPGSLALVALSAAGLVRRPRRRPRRS